MHVLPAELAQVILLSNNSSYEMGFHATDARGAMYASISVSEYDEIIQTKSFLDVASRQRETWTCTELLSH